jgi:hypothetical protein
MQVRWQRQKVNNGFKGHAVNLVAVLVEQSREAGRTKERIIEELGSVKEQFLTIRATDTRAFHQGLFWAAVEKKLDGLELDSSVRETIEVELMEKVPKPQADWALWGVTCIPRYDPS